MTKSEIAASLGLKPRQVDNLVVEGMPRKKVGRSWVYGQDAEAWYWRRKVEAAGSAKKGQLDAARMRRELAQAELAEIDVATRRGELIPLDDAKREVGRIAELVTAKLRAAGGRFAHRWQAARSHQEAQGVIDEIMREILTDLRSTLLEPHRNGDGRRRARPRKRPPRRSR
jgi:phage terminase Nu1 subunit (DNA packaging protein)